MENKGPGKKLSGFTLIEMIVFIFIFSVVTLAFYRVMVTGIQVALDSKIRLAALALAGEKMEIARNLKYEDIGTTNGIPSGTLQADETVLSGGTNFKVNTFVQFVDDDLDGVHPADAVPEDYKRLKVTVSWGSVASGTKEVSLVSQFVPPGLEVGTGEGVLSIHIINGAGEGIPQADVHITNTSVSPSVNVSQKTDNNGNLVLPGALQSIYSYAINVSKTGYETVNTIDPTSVNYAHIDVHASVVNGLLNTKSIVIDRLANLSIRSIDQSGGMIPDVGFHLEGGRILGVNNSVVPSETVFIVDADGATGSSGEVLLANQGPGQFSITGIETPDGYTLVEVDPIVSFTKTPLAYNFSLMPGTPETVDLVFAANGVPGLIVKVLENTAAAVPIDGASVKLTNISGYSKTDSVSVDGVAFFPNDGDPLTDGEYSLEVSAAGFETYSGNIEISSLTTQEIKLNAI